MKKVLRSAIFGAAASMFVVGSGVAGTITLDKDADLTTTNDQGVITIAAEAVPALQGGTYDLDPNNPGFKVVTGRTIIYQPGITLNEGDKIRFELTNATFADTNYYFILCENMQPDPNNPGQYGVDLNKDNDTTDCFELGNIVAGGAGENYVTVRIAKPTGVTIGPDTLYVLSAGNSSANQNTYNTDDNPIITFDQNITEKQKVTIRVSYAEDVGGTTELTLAETDPYDLIQFEKQIAISFGRGTSTIDVTAPSYRKNFADEEYQDCNANDKNIINCTNDDTDLTASAGTITVDNDSDNSVEDFIPDNELNELQVTIGDDNTDYSAFDFANNRVYVDWGTDDTTDDNNYTFDQATYVATIPGANLPGHGDSMTDDVYIGVTGNNILNPQTIPVSATLSFTQAGYNSDTAQDPQFIKWDINGAQFKVPYLFNNSNTWVRISNDGPVSGDISVDLYDEEGNKITNVQLGTIQPNSSIVLLASDIVNTAVNNGWVINPTAHHGRFTAKFTVTAPAETISAVAVQRIPGGVDRVIPVLDQENTWDQ